MRLKKESMRQIADAGMVQRASDTIKDAMLDPFKRPLKPEDRPVYFRGALVKRK